MTAQNRRRFLKAAGATGLGIGLAGCLNQLNQYGGRSDSTPGGINGTEDTPTEPTPTEAPSKGTVIEDFEDGVNHWHEFNSYGSFEATTDVRNGEGGIRLLAAEEEPYVVAVRSFSDPLDLDGKNVSISFKASSPEIHRIEVQLVAPDDDNVLRLNRTHTGPMDYWLNIDLGATHVRGDPDLSEVFEIRLIGRDRAQEQPIDMVIDEIRVHDASDQGKIMFTFDDCHETQYRAFEIMEEYGFPGVDGVIHQAVGARDRLTVDQLREMQSAGWDIVSHPHPPEGGSSPLTNENWSEDEQRTIIEDSIDWLESRGFEEGARHYIAPGNLRGSTNLELLREYHDSSMSYGGGSVALPITDHHAIGRIDGFDPEDVKKGVDLAVKYNQLVVPMWHTIGDDPADVETTEEGFRDLLDYVEAANVEVVTQSDIVA